MSTVCVITPMVIGAWPGMVAATIGAAQALGLGVVSASLAAKLGVEERAEGFARVQIEVENSEVIAEHLGEQQEIVLQAEQGVILRVSRDDRGALRVCAEGESVSKQTLTQLGETLAGRIVQQFAYNHLMTELNARHFDVVENVVEKDQSIRVRVRTHT